jgi:hypothetical protein
MNRYLILTVFGTGVALLFLAPFYIAIAVAFHKAKLKNELEIFNATKREYPEDDVDDALNKIFGGTDNE